MFGGNLNLFGKRFNANQEALALSISKICSAELSHFDRIQTGVTE